jgi:quercetin dioxygenase-like cupin family protein
MNLERHTGLVKDDFEHLFLQANKPVIVTDACQNWQALTKWTPEFFCQQFGDFEVQAYDDLFTLTGITTLGEYIQQYFHTVTPVAITPPYIRAYCQFKPFDFIWADALFERLGQDWSLPYFLPAENYVLPQQTIFKPNEQACPAKGLFISAPGCQTNWHQDPWQSDAVLCQIVGEKSFSLAATTPAQIDYSDILKPGEILYIPRGWHHQVITLSPSISLTWNFVHVSKSEQFSHFLRSDLSLDDKSIMAFFKYT